MEKVFLKIVLKNFERILFKQALIYVLLNFSNQITKSILFQKSFTKNLQAFMFSKNSMKILIK